MGLRKLNDYLNGKFSCYVRLKSFIKKQCYILYRLYILIKASHIRRKKSIKVLFVVSEASTWKTEYLYNEMLDHPRFAPYIGISNTQENVSSKQILIEYLNEKGYLFEDLDDNPRFIDTQGFDLVFYYKPYSGSFSKGCFYDHHRKIIPCGVNYCYTLESTYTTLWKEIYDYCWFYFAQNEIECRNRKKILGHRANNAVVTGFPMQDELNRPKGEFANPWKKAAGKKKIIYAPHHSIPGTNGDGVEFATFLIYGKFILELADKYKDKVSFAFKPHPNLYQKLVSIWGQSATDEYYKAWECGDNTQIERGEYVGLFKHSDAMIHDSASFIIEYHFTGNPIMFLRSDSLRFDRFGEFAKQAFDIQYIAKNKDDIEQFILNVINGNDPMANQRREFYKKNLLPPHGNSASTNIIKAILGEAPYDKC